MLVIQMEKHTTVKKKSQRKQTNKQKKRLKQGGTNCKH